MNAIHKFFRKHVHLHIIRLAGIATGSTGKGTRAITGWGWKCILCNEEFFEYTQSAVDMIDEGKKSADIFVWSCTEKESE